MPDLPKRVAAYVSANAEQIELAGPVEIVGGGERSNNVAGAVERSRPATGCAASIGIPSSSAIGGGAMLDAVGYAAATTHRGVRMIRVPTTVLAQDDSGVGVKNGVNAFGTRTSSAPSPRLRRHQRLRVPRDARAARPARRHGGGGQGRADPGRARSSPGSRRGHALARFEPTPLERSDRALRRAAHARTSRTAATPSSAAAPARSTSAIGPRTSSRRSAQRAAPRRGRRHRHRARHALLGVAGLLADGAMSASRLARARSASRSGMRRADARLNDGRRARCSPGSRSSASTSAASSTITLLQRIGTSVDAHNSLDHGAARSGDRVATAEGRPLRSSAPPRSPHLT